MRRTERSHLPIYAATHPGMRGKNNEDRYGVSAYRLRAGRDAPRVVLAVLADGIGGHRAGEVAAEMVVENISAFFAPIQWCPAGRGLRKSTD
jgi:serine/threonine protein phosphatase PrpC